MGKYALGSPMRDTLKILNYSIQKHSNGVIGCEEKLEKEKKVIKSVTREK